MTEIGFPDPTSPAFLVRRPGGGDYLRAGSSTGGSATSTELIRSIDFTVPPSPNPSAGETFEVYDYFNNFGSGYGSPNYPGDGGWVDDVGWRQQPGTTSAQVGSINIPSTGNNATTQYGGITVYGKFDSRGSLTDSSFPALTLTLSRRTGTTVFGDNNDVFSYYFILKSDSFELKQGQKNPGPPVTLQSVVLSTDTLALGAPSSPFILKFTWSNTSGLPVFKADLNGTNVLTHTVTSVSGKNDLELSEVGEFSIARGANITLTKVDLLGYETTVNTPATISDIDAAVLRYTRDFPVELNDSLFRSRPYGYSGIQLWWGTPPEVARDWLQVVITRSGFGHPVSPTDGEIILNVGTPATDEERENLPGSLLDLDLPQGRWFYYTLFFRVGTKWYGVKKTQNLVPKFYDHKNRMLDLVPPFYTYVEEQSNTDFLNRWMDVIGYDLDLTRTLAEGIEAMFDPDTAPQPLFEALGRQNFGFPNPSGLGDVRFRSVISETREISKNRGTSSGLQTYVRAAVKARTTVTDGVNEMLLVDDTEFHQDTGNWAAAPWNIVHYLAADLASNPSLADTAAPTRAVRLSKSSAYAVPTDIPAARGIAKITPNGDHMCVTCGAGQKKVVSGVEPLTASLLYDEVHLDAPYRGIAADAGSTYYFSFYLRRDSGNTDDDVVHFGFAEFAKNPTTWGLSDGFKRTGFRSWMNQEVLDVQRASKSVLSSAPDPANWARFVASFTLGSQTRYIVPFIWVHGTSWSTKTTTPRYLTGCMVTRSQDSLGSTTYQPDDFLILTDNVSDAPQTLGAPGAAPNDIKKVLGEP